MPNSFGNMCLSVTISKAPNRWNCLKLKTESSNSFGNMCCRWRYQSSLTDEKLLKLKTEMLEFLRRYVLSVTTSKLLNRWKLLKLKTGMLELLRQYVLSVTIAKLLTMKTVEAQNGRCSNSFCNMCCPWRYQSSLTDWKLLKLKTEMLESFGNMVCPWRYQSPLTDETVEAQKRRCSNSFGNMCCPWRYQSSLTDEKLLKLKTEMLEFLRQIVLPVTISKLLNRWKRFWSSKRRCSNSFGYMVVRDDTSSFTRETLNAQNGDARIPSAICVARDDIKAP
jgi:hypothetical protein